MRLDTEFGSRVEIYDKQRLLSGLHATATREQLTVVVMSFDSLRARNKDDRKMNQENGANIGFEFENGTFDAPEGIDPTSSMAALRHLNPVVIVDESHNQERIEISIEETINTHTAHIPDALNKQVKKYQLRDVFREQARALHLPQFFLKYKIDPFSGEEGDLLFDKKRQPG